ncbi:glycosyltransferase family 2 protein [Candidatus Poriferisodalis sp.]|uniref:glycosyltransferase family 2 protein n=1 Tax=Candidatus Poriferisodalis sp. TaxID=3101277 RepID=UPI003B59D72A
MSQPIPPADIRGNDWRSLPAAPAEHFVPERSVSVVITYFEAPEALELTLAALERQTYPRDLFEVVVVDDGSRVPVETPSHCPFEIRVVHQEDLGFGLARARNTGVKAASNDIIAFLDCDMMPEAGWMAGHARWHHAASDVLTLGFRAHVDVAGIDADAVRNRIGSLSDLFEGRAVDRPEWIEFHMVRTNELTSDADDLFRVVTGGNLGVSRSFFELVGGYDESFTQWGCEDTEFGYRAFTRGGVLVPARSAMCWHQGPGAAPSSNEKASLELQRAKISQLIAHHGFRQAKPGRSFSVPQHVVTVTPGSADPETLLDTVERILGSTLHDLVVWINESPHRRAGNDPEYERLRRLLGGDARVQFGPDGAAAEELPAAAFHITVPAGAELAKDDLARLSRTLKSTARTSLDLADGNRISLTRARFVHRVVRTGKPLEQVVAGASCEAPKNQPPPLEGAERPARPARPARKSVPTLPRREERKAAKAADSAARADRRRTHAMRQAARPPAAERIQKIRDMSRRFSRQAAQIRSREEATHFARAVGAWVGAALAWRLRWIVWKHRQAARWLMWKTLRAQSWARRASRRTMWKTLRAQSWARRASRRTMWKTLRAQSWARRASRRTMWKTLRAQSWARRASRRTMWKTLRAQSWARRASRRTMWKTLRAQSWARRASRRTMWKTRRAHRWTRQSLGPSTLGIQPATYRLGPHLVARGTTASEIFEASSRVDDELGHATRAVLIDDTSGAPIEADGASVRIIKVADLDPTARVPAFDAEQVNPKNWSLECRRMPAALGPVALLPEELEIRKTTNPDKILACRRFHHVVDIGLYHESTPRRAASLAALAASGVVVHVIDEDPNLRTLLGPDLYTLMTDPKIPMSSEQERESLSVAMRREALRNHSLRVRARQVFAVADLEAPAPPLVSILLATCRPALVESAIKSVAIQSYPHIELVLALHGDGFDHAEIDGLQRQLPIASKVVPVPASAPLGAVLNAAVEASSGTLLTKFDDDDFYGSEHVWDLVLAHEYSRACLVGKAAEYVYLERSNRTIHRFRGGAERLSSELSLAGGAMIISRNDLDSILGWQEIPSGVDKALIEDVVASGRRLYRTHGKGYVLVRHGDAHTWGVNDAYFEEQAHEVREGCDLAFAGFFREPRDPLPAGDESPRD